MFFVYGEKEISYLKAKDKRLGNAIDQIGHIDRAVDTDCSATKFLRNSDSENEKK